MPGAYCNRHNCEFEYKNEFGFGSGDILILNRIRILPLESRIKIFKSTIALR